MRFFCGKLRLIVVAGWYNCSATAAGADIKSAPALGVSLVVYVPLKSL
jgi:hypothetical protein